MPIIIPVLRVFDYDKIIEFYVKWMDFSVEWEHRPEDAPFYMQVSLRGSLINLSQHHGECSPGARIIISDFKGLEVYHRSLQEKQYRFMHPGLDRPEWDRDTLAMSVIDPFYNIIEFNEKISS